MIRARHGTLVAGVLVGIIIGPRLSNAQYTANFQTNIISGVTSNWTGDYIVGSTNVADVLLIQNSGVLSNNDGYLGHDAGSSNNSVVVTDIASGSSARAQSLARFGETANCLSGSADRAIV